MFGLSAAHLLFTLRQITVQTEQTGLKLLTYTIKDKEPMTMTTLQHSSVSSVSRKQIFPQLKGEVSV